jgi:hypothetical protein
MCIQKTRRSDKGIFEEQVKGFDNGLIDGRWALQIKQKLIKPILTAVLYVPKNLK